MCAIVEFTIMVFGANNLDTVSMLYSIIETLNAYYAIKFFSYFRQIGV